MRRTLAIMLAGLMAVSVAGAAVAKPDKAKGPKGKNLVFLGTVTSVSDDGVADTTDSLTVAFIKGNKHARTYVEANPGDVTVMVGDGTRLRFQGDSLALTDLRPGDGVRVKARAGDDGVMGKKVKLVPLRYHGTVESFDAGTGMGTVLVEKANRVGNAYLVMLGNPASLPILVTATSQVNREGGGDPQPGDEYEMRGRPTTDGTGVEVLRLNAAPPSA